MVPYREVNGRLNPVNLRLKTGPPAWRLRGCDGGRYVLYVHAQRCEPPGRLDHSRCCPRVVGRWPRQFVVRRRYTTGATLFPASTRHSLQRRTHVKTIDFRIIRHPVGRHFLVGYMHICDRPITAVGMSVVLKRRWHPGQPRGPHNVRRAPLTSAIDLC